MKQCLRRIGIDPSPTISDLKSPHSAAEAQISTVPRVYLKGSIRCVNKLNNIVIFRG